MIIYHGGIVPIEAPKILKSERMLDFGEGFYTTSNKEQAERWSQRVAVKRNVKTRFLTEYEFDFEDAAKELSIITFDKPGDEWLEFVCGNSSGKLPQPLYDIAIGPVADDRVYATVVLYEQGVISKEAAITELKVRKLYDQILFHTERALTYCRYIGYTLIGGSTIGKE
jgi:hypothetical protein